MTLEEFLLWFWMVVVSCVLTLTPVAVVKWLLDDWNKLGRTKPTPRRDVDSIG